MDKLLRFLNAADINLLTTIPGISLRLAEALVAARPFDSVEDSLKVSGMSKKLLTRIETALETSDFEEEEHALIPAEEAVWLPEKSQPMKEMPGDNKPSFGSRMGIALRSFVRALFRLILLLLVIGGIGAALYFGLPVIRERYIAPVEQNSARVLDLENEVGDLKIQLSEVNSRLDAMDTSIEAHTVSLENLEDIQRALETQLEEKHDKTLAKLNQQVMMARALDMLARARLYLAQSNFGLAKEDVQSARDVLAELQSQSGEEILAQAITRLDLALENLPTFPIIASGDLEIAWQILITGKTVTATPTEPALNPTITPQPTEVIATATP